MLDTINYTRKKVMLY